MRRLQRAWEMYSEAFRQDMDDYYPAINAAYLGLIGAERTKGRSLARYIIAEWRDRVDEDWWTGSAVAEAYMLDDQFDIVSK